MLRRDLGVEVTLEAGPYGSFQVRADDEVVVTGGPLAFLGVLPSLSEIRSRVARQTRRTRRISRSVSLHIRPFQSADLPALQRCVVEMQDSERAIDPRLRPGAEIASVYCDQLEARCAVHSGAILVADYDGNVVGFVAVLARVPFEDLDDPPGDRALVSDLVVLASHRRQGIGGSLLAAAEAHAVAHQARELQIGVLAANLGARELYRAVGFTPHLEILTKSLPTGGQDA